MSDPKRENCIIGHNIARNERGELTLYGLSISDWRSLAARDEGSFVGRQRDILLFAKRLVSQQEIMRTKEVRPSGV